MTIVTDLPEDILAITFSFLDARAFLAFCQTCRDLYQYSRDPAYWRTITSTTFRLPISPLLKADGGRWYWLYKRLRTQTRLYTWGQGLKGDLGLGSSRPALFGRPHIIRRRLPTIPAIPNPGVVYQRTTSSWPTEVHVPDEVGVIADMQCGGWSTSILSSDGIIYTVGSIDSLDGLSVGESTDQFRRLEYLTQSSSAVRQFSSGRRHILALTDDGEVVSWDRIDAKGLKVFSRSSNDFGGKAVRVAAGWGESSAYVPETGIVYWIPLVNDQNDDMLDGRHVKEKIIPGTARHISKDNQVTEVIKHIVLEGWIVWLTSNGKLYACDLQVQSAEQQNPSSIPFEVPGFASSARVLIDVQGQFNKFATFTENGEVLAGNTHYLWLCSEKARANVSPDDNVTLLPISEWSGLNELVSSRPADNPALQHNQVISLAYGDHHYHALHVNGRITSYGHEPQSCGALGLGSLQSGARFRGLHTFHNFRPDSALDPHAERRGREIWFEPEKRDWLIHLEESLKSGRLDTDTRSAVDQWNNFSEQSFMFSEWVEQEGRYWQDGPSQNRETSKTVREAIGDENDFHLDSYFALTVAAAGWHSGALVLVDDAKAHAVRGKWITHTPQSDDHEEDEHAQRRFMPGHFESGPVDPEEIYVWRLEGFPKVKLPNGFEMPGEGEQRLWRKGVPTTSDLGLPSTLDPES